MASPIDEGFSDESDVLVQDLSQLLAAHHPHLYKRGGDTLFESLTSSAGQFSVPPQVLKAFLSAPLEDRMSESPAPRCSSSPESLL